MTAMTWVIHLAHVNSMWHLLKSIVSIHGITTNSYTRSALQGQAMLQQDRENKSIQNTQTS